MNTKVSGAEAYRRPGLPPACAADVGGCALGGCDGLQSVSVVETVPHGYKTTIFEDTGVICPEFQIATADGQVYPRAKPLAED